MLSIVGVGCNPGQCLGTYIRLDALLKRLEPGFEDLKLQDSELEWLKKTCPYLHPDYLEWLAAFRFKPKEQLTLRFVPDPQQQEGSSQEVGNIEIEVRGLWSETILYETSVMAVVSEAYFVHVDKDWTMDGQEGTFPELAHTVNGLSLTIL